MSSIFQSPSIVTISDDEEETVSPEVANMASTVYELESKNKKKMGATSQVLSTDSYFAK